MTVDVVCVGSPFLDLIFRGLPALPEPGEEQLARDLVIVPGAMANVAFAIGRLGLRTAVLAPIGRDPAGRLLQELMAEAGVEWIGPATDRTPVTVALPAHGDRAFVTLGPDVEVDPAPLRELQPRAVVIDLPAVAGLPDVPIVYAVVGDPEVRLLVGNMPASLEPLRALLVNAREARALAGTDDLDTAAMRLADLGTLVVVTCGSDGAMAVEPGGAVVRAAAPETAVDDPTGAGDLFTGAFVWADLDGRSLEERLHIAATYASISLAAAGRSQKGVTREELERAIGRGRDGAAPSRGGGMR
jgi:sugar/nucleoside kinase (ribokinase family)